MNKQFVEDMVNAVKQDFENRKKARRPYENQWKLNMNFVVGDQYCDVTPLGNVEDYPKQYFWQEREVYNHIAPILETRLAKLGRVKCGVSVRPNTSDENDVNSAKFSTKLLSSICSENNLTELINTANSWSEVTGSCFYKVVWDKNGGEVVGLQNNEPIYEGDVKITVCPPYEIYPSSLSVSDVELQESIIHAKAYSVEEIERRWKQKVNGEKINVFTMENSGVGGGLGYNSTVTKVSETEIENSAVVIEKYTAPTLDKPNGELVIVCGDKLLYYGELPFVNGKNGKRTYPFIKQVSLAVTGSFFGSSVIERCIPIQRAYNAVKNRKHEFLNRISMGVLAVEDGSVDTDNLEEEGLSPGKVLVYRQGSMPPTLLDPGKVPTDFHYEEEKLLNEFVMISGVSEIMKYSKMPANVTSGVAISLLIEQDDTRISITADFLRNAVKKIGEQIIRLYREYGGVARLKRVAGENGEIEMKSFSSSQLTSDDIVFDTDNELTDTLASRRSMVLELLKMGILADENGVISSRNKTKVLEMLGFGNWESARDVEQLHIKKAIKENDRLKDGVFDADSYDDHELHVEEHIKYLLSEDNEKDVNHKNNVVEHIASHKVYLQTSNI